MKSNPTLKPCPFCGCPDAVVLKPEDLYLQLYSACVECPDCGAQTAIQHAEDDALSVKMAADLWNRRTSP